jgi:hypothetical protein
MGAEGFFGSTLNPWRGKEVERSIAFNPRSAHRAGHSIVTVLAN